MKNITSILNALTQLINNAETTSTTTATTTSTVDIDGTPTTSTHKVVTETVTRTHITHPDDAPKKPTIITKLTPAVGWTNPYETPLKLRDEPYRLITSDFKKEGSSFMMSVVREYPDGRQEKMQHEGYDIKMFKRNLEGSIESLKEDIALREWDHILFADNHSRRWWYYLTSEYIRDPEVQQLMRWFNSQIKAVNRFYEGVERRLQHVREEVLADLGDNDEEMVANIAADLDEIRAERDNLLGENAALAANLAEAERDLESTQVDLADSEESIDDLNKEISELRYQLSVAHKRSEKQSERMADIEKEIFRLADVFGCADEIRETNAENIIDVLRKHLIKE